jgi:hypothetical protein
MIGFEPEKLISFAEACDLVPRRRRGVKLHVSTLYRWWTKGLRGVRLEAVSCGGSPATTAEALHRFFAAVAAAKAPGAGPAPPAKTPRAARKEMTTRARRQLDTNRELDKLGIGGGP